MRSLTLGARRAGALLLGLTALAGPSAAAPPGNPSPGEVVGRFEVVVPYTGSFLLHGTLPLPTGTWTQPDTVGPLRVRDHDGSLVTTQTEVVSRYPSMHDGVDVAEILALVHAPPGLSAGDRTTYDVIYSPHGVNPPPAASIAGLLDGPVQVPAGVRDLLSDPGGLVLQATDVFGNTYTSLPLDGSGTQELLRHGPVQSELRIAQTLMPTTTVPGPTGTLPHHLGVHVYVKVTSGDEVVGLDVRMHNAHSGVDPSDPRDDPLDTVYFKNIQIYVPSHWAVVQDYFDPFLSLPAPVGTYTQYPLVRANGDGTVHSMEWQAQFHRRLAIARPGEVDVAQADLRGAGLGFARKGKSPAGKPLWSWWSGKTARWFPQSHVLPNLGHVGAAAIRAGLAGELGHVQGHLEAGTADFTYPIDSPVLGHAHPYGVAYGGMTSGNEIFLYDGLRTVWSASMEGYRLARIVHRMHSDRMPSALYDADGSPSGVDDWVVQGSPDYVPFDHFMTPHLTSSDPFGVWKAPTFHKDYVENNGLLAHHALDLEGFDPHDFQHLIRYTRSAKVLTWLANDSLAKDDLRMQAENFHLSYHSNVNGAGGYVQPTGLRWDQDHVRNYPGTGFTFGRGEAWGLDCAVAAYATSSESWRARNRPWLDEVAQVLADGQSTCSGLHPGHGEHQVLRQEVPSPAGDRAVDHREHPQGAPGDRLPRGRCGPHGHGGTHPAGLLLQHAEPDGLGPQHPAVPLGLHRRRPGGRLAAGVVLGGGDADRRHQRLHRRLPELVLLRLRLRDLGQPAVPAGRPVPDRLRAVRRPARRRPGQSGEPRRAPGPGPGGGGHPLAAGRGPGDA